MPAITYREAEAEDLRFIVMSWLDSFRCAHAAGMIQMSDWRDVMAPQVHKVLARPDARAFCAVNPNTPDRRVDVHGWIATEVAAGAVPLVHYIYVKQAYRRMGIARALMRAAGIDPNFEFHYTCKTGVVSKLPIQRARWMPLIARFNPETTGETIAEDRIQASDRAETPAG